jgi:potassium efflux system protein
MQKRWFLACWAPLVVLCLGIAQSHAALPQPVSTPAPPPENHKNTEFASPTPEAIEQKIAELDQKIKTAQEAENEQTAQQLGVDLALLQKKTQLLKEIKESYGWWLEILKKQAALEKDKTKLQEKFTALKDRGVTEPPPYSLAFYQDLVSKLQTFEQREEAYAMRISLFQEYLSILQGRLEEARKKWRGLQRNMEIATLPEAKKKLQVEVELADLQRDLAEKEYFSVKTYLDILNLYEGMANQEEEIYRKQATWVQKHLRIQDSDLDQQLALLSQDQNRLAVQRTKIQRVMEQKARIWERAKKEAKGAEASGPVYEAASQEKEAWQQAYQRILDSLDNRLSILRSKEAFWKRRLSLLKGEATPEQLLRWQKDVKERRDIVSKYAKYLGDDTVMLQAQLATLEKRLANPDLDPKLKDLLTSQKAAYLAVIQEQNGLMQTLAGTDQLARRFSEEIRANLTQDPWSAFVARIKVALHHFLDYDIWVIDNQAVTVSKFLEALVFLILGLLLARIILHRLIYPVLEKTLWRHVKAEILQKTVSYLAYIVVVLITLGKLRIPLQSFATLGGGIAIGLGFAAQTVIKNFISGFILLGEKPIGIGDLVEVGGILGNVQDIGSRSTLLRTGENKDILVPNSYFLENTITNWTRKDRRIRAQVTVGVAYGSPVEKVKELLLQAAAEQDQILKTPQPFVLFNDFGDNSLIFDLYIWIEVAGVMGRRILQSALRFKIDELFRAAGIVIAFPQRDVHLDTQGPLEVHLVDKGQE